MIYAIITDIHEDIESLEKVFFKISELKIDRIICLGDIVGFDKFYNKSFIKTKSANKCVRLIKSISEYAVSGNHDLNAIRKLPVKSSFEFPKNWYTLSEDEKRKISKNKVHLHSNDILPKLSQPNISYLKKTQHELVFDNILLSHFLYPNITGFEKVTNNHLSLVKKHFNYMHSRKCRISFVGHLHNFGMQIITNNGIHNIHKNLEYKISKEMLNIIICPPIVQSSKTFPAYTLYNDITKTIKWNHI